ncbi:DegT/DnrJ/EryC1/StrS family aminotransferase [Aurantimicrobium minutum]|uniref:DegT/DnrJ/EryC1/StrS family aminotransferase n=1 Tax=Aurantimicrobium minutum TaxID=708131 RepID=UPI00247695D8|nr:aminotransferase class I/II-fold pyridoxal phosphate-dependent enzyme [Aurantimicrobium minutum]MDH6208375.1 dTDP-4-amino-4,6-dideoxygalactose transaminase [Aurantimicrobium minutum]
MTEKIYMSAPDVGQLEEVAVIRAMKSGWVAPLGPEVDAFESEVSQRVGVSNAVALSSGTSALHLGLLALGVKPGDVVVTSTMTFIATANAILYTGAEPFFVDSELSTGNISPALLRESIELLKSQGRSIGAIVPVDLLGKAVNYTEITKIAQEFNIPILCDAAESFGATHNGKPAGSWGDASIISFNGNKIMTTSGGGMLLTNNGSIAQKVRYLATQARQPVIHYEHTDVGYNYRLSNVLAALGRAQLSRLDDMIAARRSLRSRYRDLFSAIEGVEIFDGGDDTEDNCWLTSIVVDSDHTGWSTSELLEYLATFNIETRPLWKPMHRQPLFIETPSLTNGTSEYLFENGLTLPSGSAMTIEQIEIVIASIQQFLNK